MERRKRFSVTRYSTPAAEACRIENSARSALLAEKAKYKLTSQAAMTSESNRKHWFDLRFGLAWNTTNPRPSWMIIAARVGVVELFIDCDTIDDHRASASPKTANVDQSAVHFGLSGPVGNEVEIALRVGHFVVSRWCEDLVTNTYRAGSQLKWTAGRQ